MIVPTMTLAEVATEIQSDYKEVINRWEKFEPKFNRIRMKKKSYPWFWETTVMTKRKNEWNIIFYAYSKKDASIIIPRIYLSFRYENSTWAASFIKGHNQILIFSAHFLERYIERFLETDKKEMECPIKDLVKYFFLRNNHIACYKSEIEDSLRGFCEDGMFLGDWLSDSVALVKTYLSRNELKPNQYTEFYEIVISWIVQDMFVSRKGYSYNIEEFDQLPDSFFEPNEWNAFLFNRNNPIWINIAKECAKFKREHPEEYEKCSQMLEAIQENRLPPELGVSK